MNLKDLLKEKGIKPSDFSSVIWPESSYKTRGVLVNRLINGKMDRFHINKIVPCCRFLNDMPIQDFINVLIETNKK